MVDKVFALLDGERRFGPHRPQRQRSLPEQASGRVYLRARGDEGVLLPETPETLYNVGEGLGCSDG